MTDRLNITGIVIEVSNNKMLLRLSGLLDESDEQWIDIPAHFPEWALNGCLFHGTIRSDIERWNDLINDPTGLQVDRISPSASLTDDELREKLKRMTDDPKELPKPKKEPPPAKLTDKPMKLPI